MNFRTRTSLNFRKPEIFLTLNIKKKFTFLQPFTGKVQGMLITLVLLLQDAQNSIYSLKKNILGCQHADQ